MQNFYERLVELLGESHDAQIFQKFLVDLDDEPCVFPHPAATVYNFPKSGFTLLTDAEFVKEVFAEIRTPSYTVTNEFRGLPAGITKDDQRQDIQRKLGIKPAGSGLNRKTGETIDHFRLSRVVLSFNFERDSDLLASVRMRLSHKT
jgi:hypothetical protein